VFSYLIYEILSGSSFSLKCCAT